MILNTGMRTDIPAFFAPWFASRLREGYVLSRSPYAPTNVTRYRLSPDVVDLIGFCTKNPAPMFPCMDLLRPYGQYWFVTITPYGRDIEPNVPPKEQVMEDFRRLSAWVGPDCVGWRYDPILLNETYSIDRHLRNFEAMARTLEGSTHTCVISFIDLYEKVKRNFPEIRAVEQKDRMLLGREMAAIANRYGMTLRPCGEGDELAPFGADCSGCMTIPVYEKALGQKLSVPKFKPSRKECACYLGGDIGAYHTCAHLCRYCYANYDEKTVRANLLRHDPASPLLLGHLMPSDVVRDAKQESWIVRQLSLFDL